MGRQHPRFVEHYRTKGWIPAARFKRIGPLVCMNVAPRRSPPRTWATDAQPQVGAGGSNPQVTTPRCSDAVSYVWCTCMEMRARFFRRSDAWLSFPPVQDRTWVFFAAGPAGRACGVHVRVRVAGSRARAGGGQTKGRHREGMRRAVARPPHLSPRFVVERWQSHR